MGYYTQYELAVENGDLEEIEEAITKKYDGYNPFGDSTKWYNYEDHCRLVSLDFPSATIIISGVGEEQPDMWKHWFRNGKHKKCVAEITFNEPDW